MFNSFDADIAVPNVNTYEELAHVLHESGAFSEPDQRRAIEELRAATRSNEVGVGINKILFAIETARQDEDMPGRLANVLARAVAARGYSE